MDEKNNILEFRESMDRRSEVLGNRGSHNNSKLFNAKFRFNPEGYWKNPIDTRKHNISSKAIQNYLI